MSSLVIRERSVFCSGGVWYYQVYRGCSSGSGCSSRGGEGSNAMGRDILVKSFWRGDSLVLLLSSCTAAEEVVGGLL